MSSFLYMCLGAIFSYGLTALSKYTLTQMVNSVQKDVDALKVKTERYEETLKAEISCLKGNDIKRLESNLELLMKKTDDVKSKFTSKITSNKK